MIFIKIIVFVIGFVVGGYIFSDYFEGIMLVIMSAIIASVCVYATIAIIEDLRAITEEYTIEYELKNLYSNNEENSNLKGIYFLGIGYLGGSNDSEMYYKFYAKDNEGYIKYWELALDGYDEVKLKEAEETPKLIIHKEIKKTEEGKEISDIVSWYEIIIPEGTIFSEYNLDI